VSIAALATGADAETQVASATAVAAADAAADAPGVQDIVVTATRQSTKLQQTPVAVTVIGSAQIAAQNIITTRDLAGQTPGVTIQRAGITPLTQVFFIRGIGDADPIFDPNVAVYIDDVYLPRAINGMTDLTDIERVEVLRGPQGTLFGENADAGAIRYITKTPTDHTEFNFDIGGGTYNAFSAHGYVAGAIVPGLLDGNLAVARDQHDGYTWDPTLHQHVNNQDTTGARGKLLATFSPKFTVLLTVDGTLDNSASDYYAPERPIIGGTLQHPVYGAFNPNDSYASQKPKNDSWVGGVSLKGSYQIDDHLTFNSVSAFRAFAQDPVNYNNDGQPLVPYSTAVPTPVSISDNFIVYREKEATQEFQLLGKYDKFDFASGLYFLYEDFSSNRIGYVVSPTAATAAPAYPEDQIGDTKTTDYAFYTQGNYHLTSALTFTLGARYTIEHRDFTFEGLYDTLAGDLITPTPGAPTSTPGGYAAVNDFSYHGHKTWYSFTPKAGISYQFTPDLFGYFSYSQGFDAGGFNNRASSLITALPYNQENVTTYEAGLKSDWFEHKLRLNGTVFYNDYKGLQETAAVPSPITGGYVSVRSNANRAHTEGAELESVIEPIDGLRLTGNASYLWTRFDSFANAAVVSGHLVSATGNQLPLSPRWQLFAGGSYKVPLNIPGALTIGADATYETSYFSDVFNYRQGQVPAQGYIDAFVSYAPKDSHLTFSLTGKNLANRLAYQSITWGGTPNLWEGAISPPRTIFFKISYSR
jgi:iron complex outermembrane receptor protein